MTSKRELKAEIADLYTQAHKLIGKNKPYQFRQIINKIILRNKKLDKLNRVKQW